MIVREIADPKYQDEVLNNFDYFNDYKDTHAWCRINAPHLLSRLENGFDAYNKNGRKYDIEPVLWTFENDEGVQDYEALTRLGVEMLANEVFAEQCQDESPANNETFEHPVKLLAFQYNDDGERVILEEIETHLIYCHYHGDLKEHGTC